MSCPLPSQGLRSQRQLPEPSGHRASARAQSAACPLGAACGALCEQALAHRRRFAFQIPCKPRDRKQALCFLLSGAAPGVGLKPLPCDLPRPLQIRPATKAVQSNAELILSCTGESAPRFRWQGLRAAHARASLPSSVVVVLATRRNGELQQSRRTAQRTSSLRSGLLRNNKLNYWCLDSVAYAYDVLEATQSTLCTANTPTAVGTLHNR
jgi:hypothetical protein